MYAVTSNPFVNLTRAIFLNAEFGFFGVDVLTAVQTPRFCGADRFVSLFLSVFKPFCIAGEFDLNAMVSLPFLTSWLNVGIISLLS